MRRDLDHFAPRHKIEADIETDEARARPGVPRNLAEIGIRPQWHAAMHVPDDRLPVQACRLGRYPPVALRCCHHRWRLHPGTGPAAPVARERRPLQLCPAAAGTARSLPGRTSSKTTPMPGLETRSKLPVFLGFSSFMSLFQEWGYEGFRLTDFIWNIPQS